MNISFFESKCFNIRLMENTMEYKSSFGTLCATIDLHPHGHVTIPKQWSKTDVTRPDRWV